MVLPDGTLPHFSHIRNSSDTFFDCYGKLRHVGIGVPALEGYRLVENIFAGKSWVPNASVQVEVLSGTGPEAEVKITGIGSGAVYRAVMSHATYKVVGKKVVTRVEIKADAPENIGRHAIVRTHRYAGGASNTKLLEITLTDDWVPYALPVWGPNTPGPSHVGFAVDVYATGSSALPATGCKVRQVMPEDVTLFPVEKQVPSEFTPDYAYHDVENTNSIDASNVISAGVVAALQTLIGHQLGIGRENSARDSNDFDSSYWSSSSTIVRQSNAAAGPDGEFTASEITRTGGSTAHAIYTAAQHISDGSGFGVLLAVKLAAGYPLVEPGLTVRDYTGSAYPNRSARIRKGPGSLVDITNAIKLVGASETEYTIIEFRCDAVPVGNGARLLFYPNKGGGGDAVIHACCLDFSNTSGPMGSYIPTSGAVENREVAYLERTNLEVINDWALRLRARFPFAHDDNKGVSSGRLISLRNGSSGDLLDCYTHQSAARIKAVRSTNGVQGIGNVDGVLYEAGDDLDIVLDINQGGSSLAVNAESALIDSVNDFEPAINELRIGARTGGAYPSPQFFLRDLIIHSVQIALDADEDADSVIKAVPTLKAGNILEYDELIYNVDGTIPAGNRELYAIDSLGSVSTRATVNPGAYLLKGLRAYNGDAWTTRHTRLVLLQGPTPMRLDGPSTVSIQDNEAFNFLPEMHFNLRNTLTFSVENQPAGSEFDSSTGRLKWAKGTFAPQLLDGIVIRATTECFEAETAPFNIQINPSLTGSKAALIRPSSQGVYEQQNEEWFRNE